MENGTIIHLKTTNPFYKATLLIEKIYITAHLITVAIQQINLRSN